jgi:putative SOS response-associated peptidase YedK
MCGRFTLRASAGVITEQFSVFGTAPWKSRSNIAPSQPVLAVRLATGETKAASGRELVWLRWGLIPGWANDPSIGNRLINARADTVATKPAFRAAIRHRRCLVVADGFYEWQQTAKRKTPHLIRMRDDRPFGFAELWELWEGPDHSAIESCTLLTTEANDLVRLPADYCRLGVMPTLAWACFNRGGTGKYFKDDVLAMLPDHAR